MTEWKVLADIRRDYGEQGLSESNLDINPIIQFQRWLAAALSVNQPDCTSMVLSTVDENGLPDSRILLLKGVDNGEFVFYTNYSSTKELQLENIPYAALNFYWPAMSRQIRIRGHVNKTTAAQSDAYFDSRPIASQISAIISKQSQIVPAREFLEDEFNSLMNKSSAEPGTLKRPKNWGGYSIAPDEMEFWQGRNNRLHDRIRYV